LEVWASAAGGKKRQALNSTATVEPRKPRERWFMESSLAIDTERVGKKFPG
jgi:hypothetical protein